MPHQSNKSFWSSTIDETAKILETNSERGISEIEAQQRLEHYGKNTIDSTKRTAALKIFFNQLKSPLIIILIIAGCITIGISHYRDSIFIFIAVIVNTLLGFYQEAKAEKALSELKTYLKQRTRVMRDGKEHEIDAKDIVPGDLIRLAQGDRVPADARIIYINDFQVDEAVLTGESLPVSKSTEPSLPQATLGDQKSMVFAGTLVTQGIATALVCRTAFTTELGKIAELIGRSEKESTPLQKSIRDFSIRASMVLGGLTLVVFFIGILAGYSGLEMFLTSVAIAVSAIPEGLPISLTVILAVGVERMAKRKGVVRKLIAAETLGSTTLILTDKTGTLTMAKMELSKIIPIQERNEKQLLTYALTNCNVLIENPEDAPDTWRMNGRIMENALVRSSASQGISIETITDKSALLQILPFNPVHKFSVALIKEDSKHVLVLLGAPDILINHSSFSADKKKHILEHIDSLAFSGERVLGVARKEITIDENFSLAHYDNFSHLSLEGLITFRDPIRPGIKSTIERVTNAGIKTIIVTGDHRGTAEAVAKEIGMNVTPDSILDASELSNLSDDALQARLPHIHVISRVTPLDKLRIVKMFQERGEVVAMTGDGVNDAPSIKQADVGIAMGSGTEVAQDVADLVLLDDNFQTIVAAVEEGRHILKNIRKVLVYLLSNVTDGLILIGGSLLLGIPLPLNALQILWVNFFSDSFPAIAFAFEKEPGELSNRIRSSKSGLFDPLMKFLILVIGLSTSILLFIIYIALLRFGFDEALVRTFIFAAFGSYTLFVALSVRSLEKSIFSVPVFSNLYLLGGIGIGIVLMLAAVYLPILQSLFETVALPLPWLIAVVAIGILNIFVIELGKWLFRIRNKYY